MVDISISESDAHCRYIAHAAAALAAAKAPAAAKVRFAGGRVRFVLSADDEKAPRLCAAAENAVAEIVCVGYKYEFMRAAVQPAGLSARERELLLAAVIAADLEADKKYVRARLAQESEHCIDGLYRFRLRPLREKWREVAAVIPPCFTAAQLHDFLEYLLRAGAGRVFLKGEDVFDSRCRRLRRARLIEEGRSELNALREIVLSGAGRVECLSAVSAAQESFLKSYYAGRVYFAR